MENKINVIVGTKSNIKICAVREASNCVFDEYNYSITDVDSESKVNNQPYGFDEIVKGAENRLSFCRESVPLNRTNQICILVAIENGIVFIDNEFYDIAYILVENEDTLEVSSSFSSTVKLPKNIIYKVTNSNYEKTIGDFIDKTNPKDPHSSLTNFNVARKDILTQALKIALSQLKIKEETHIINDNNQDIYAIHPEYGLICKVCGSSAQAQHMDCFNFANEN
jgi:non-canonical (house-cleaning) NTP pyrophosphatase